MRHRLARVVAVAVVLGAASPAVAQPTWWITGGGYAAIETGSLKDVVKSEGGAFLGGGWYLLRLGPVLVGAEAEGSAGRLTASLGIVEDTVTVLRGRVGVRATWWEEHDEPTLVPHLRAGGVYRSDQGDLVKDDGVGWYVGVGLDYRLSENWSIGPFATYEEVGLSVGTKTWLFGLGLTFAF